MSYFKDKFNFNLDIYFKEILDNSKYNPKYKNIEEFKKDKGFKDNGLKNPILLYVDISNELGGNIIC